MRTSAILLLTFSFILGAASAISVRLTIDTKPLELVEKGPTTKILIADKDIPSGSEITADAVYFVDVPVSEVPTEALTSFKYVYKRRAAYPIPAGYPVCGDFLLDANSTSTDAAFLPAGSRLVSLEVEQLRQGETVSELSEPITNYLTAGQRIIIRTVPVQEAQGLYIERKNELLKAFMPCNGVEEGDMLLDNVEILRVLGKKNESDNVRQIQSLTLMLKQEDAEKLAAAAQKFRLRVVPQSMLAKNETTAPVVDETAIVEENEKKDEIASVPQIDSEAVSVKEPLPVERRSAPVIDLTASMEKEPALTVPLKIEAAKNDWVLKKIPEVSPLNSEDRNVKEFVLQPAPVKSSPVIVVGALGNDSTQKNTDYSPFGVRSRIVSE